MTSTTLTGGVRTVQTYTDRFDSATFQLLTASTYSDSRGIRVSTKTVTKYESVADFINEVVRSSGHRGQVTRGSNSVNASAGFFERSDIGRGVYLSTAFSDSYRIVAGVGPATASASTFNVLSVSGAGAVADSGQIDWSVNTIPPLKLYRSATVTGGTPMTSVNSFDARGQLTRFVTTTQPSNIPDTTNYTAWDQFGRPTAGTKPQSREMVTLVYDDLARTLTTTYSGPGFTSVSKETYDVNGNMVLMDWNLPSGTSTTTNTFQATAVMCHGPIAPAGAR